MTPEQAAEESVTTVSIRGEVWNDALGWAALLLGAWLVLKVTQSAALAIVLATCKFGWNELLTAIWLRANDPVRPRGRACFWFCLLPGLWKILAASIVACVLLGLGASHWDLARQLGLHHKAQGLGAIIPINQAAWTALQTAAVMCAAFMVVSLIGRRQARQAGLRVWIDRALTRARHRAAWPPSQFTDENHADIAMGGAIIVALVLGMSGVLLIHRLFPQWPAEATLPALMAVSATAALVWARAFRCVIAVGPAECWPEQQGQPPPPG